MYVILSGASCILDLEKKLLCSIRILTSLSKLVQVCPFGTKKYVSFNLKADIHASSLFAKYRGSKFIRAAVGVVLIAPLLSRHTIVALRSSRTTHSRLFYKLSVHKYLRKFQPIFFFFLIHHHQHFVFIPRGA